MQVVPLYTPLRNELGDELPLSPVHLGGINAYLQQLSPRFAALPTALHDLLDRPRLLTWIGQFAVKTDPRQLGAMTLSVLQGQEGRQSSEIARLLHFLRQEIHPDVVCLTNSLLSGVASAVKAELGLPVLCSLQGEELFLGALAEPYRSRAQAQLRANARAIDLFVAPGERDAGEMAGLLDVPPARIAGTPRTPCGGAARWHAARPCALYRRISLGHQSGERFAFACRRLLPFPARDGGGRAPAPRRTRARSGVLARPASHAARGGCRGQGQLCR